MAVKLSFVQSSGDKYFIRHVWDESGHDLVESEKIDIQKEIDERAKGMTVGEKLLRIARGDMSVFEAGEASYADVTDLPKNDAAVIVGGLENSQNGASKTVADFESLKEKIQALEDPAAREKALGEYNVAYEKIKGLLGKD